jgi:phage anti-repressor protein
MLLLNESQIMKKSLEVNLQMSFKEFIIFNNIQLDCVMVDKIFHNINQDMPIYMDEVMIEYFGYSGKMIHQRESIKKLIETNFLEYQNQLWHSYKNKEYIEFCEKNIKKSSLYPPAPIGRGTSTTKHLLVMPKLFKAMLMLCQTERGKRIRNYFLDIEEVMVLYIKYQCQCEKLEFETEYKKMFSRQYTISQSILEFDKNMQNKYRIGCVYYIQEATTKNIKIGWCWKLKKRLENLQVANSQVLSVIKYELTQFPSKREQELHIIHKDNHVRGEWYDNSISDNI